MRTLFIVRLLRTRCLFKQSWDDVERKVKPTEEAREYKKRAVLDQEKSILSLGEVYEQEYVQQMQVILFVLEVTQQTLVALLIYHCILHHRECVLKDKKVGQFE